MPSGIHSINPQGCLRLACCISSLRISVNVPQVPDVAAFARKNRKMCGVIDMGTPLMELTHPVNNSL